MYWKPWISIVLLLPCSGASTTAATWIHPHNHSQLHPFLLPRQQVGSCTLNCFTKVIPQFDCPDLLQCICHDKAVTAALQACALASGCSIREGLQGQKTQAEACGFPKRDRVIVFSIVQTALFSLTAVCAILRFLARGKVFGGAGYGWDDAVLFAVCLPMLGLTVTGYMEQMAGLGKDIWELEFDRIERVLMLFYIGNTFYSFVVFGTKIAFVLLYLRIWKDSSIIFRRICQVMLVLLTIAAIGFTFSSIFLCSPVDYAWKALSGAPGKCVNRTAQLFTNSAVNIGMDFVVLLLPVRKILQLRMSKPKRFGLLCTFLVGFAATATSIIQYYYLITRLNSTQNPTWDYFDIGIWRITEMYLSITCCCMPMIAGLVKRGFLRISEAVSSAATISEVWSKTRSWTQTTTTSAGSRISKVAPKLNPNITTSGSLGVTGSMIRLKGESAPASERSVELRKMSRSNHAGSIEDLAPRYQHSEPPAPSNLSGASTAVTSANADRILRNPDHDQPNSGPTLPLGALGHSLRSRSDSQPTEPVRLPQGQVWLETDFPEDRMKSRISRVESETVSPSVRPAPAARNATAPVPFHQAAGSPYNHTPRSVERPTRPRADTSPVAYQPRENWNTQANLQLPSANRHSMGLSPGHSVWTSLQPVPPSPMSEGSTELSLTSDEILRWARRSQHDILQRGPGSMRQNALEKRLELEARSYSDRALPDAPGPSSPGARGG